MAKIIRKKISEITDDFNMAKKLRDTMLPKRFNSEDIKNWQKVANGYTGGNLTLWMELRLNESAKKDLSKLNKGGQ